MRRKDREITNCNKIDNIISSCHCCRLGFCDSGKAYIVPLNFGYSSKNGKRIFYFHSAKEGRKIDLIKQNNYATFELDTNYKLNEGDNACNYSARFQSIMGGGTIEIINEIAQKIEALNEIMKHNTGKGDWQFTDAMANTVCVLKLEVKEISCKEHN